MFEPILKHQAHNYVQPALYISFLKRWNFQK